ncbi:hypothetical protein PC115_g8140 [Phytophthora cactorum]|uniref:Uncharacterized protein n=1 Tax=Phytophthora cactorum TaxID=29920 RepID=A0A8T1CLH1_9STRA|nr:hypothetical protein PC115_g8140 [Phytophthora cactorum]
MYKQVSDDLYIRDLPWVNVYFSLQHLSLDGTTGSLVKWQFRGNECASNECTSNKCSSNKCTGNKCTGNKCAGNECSSNKCAGNKCTSNKCAGNECPSNKCTRNKCAGNECSSNKCSSNKCTSNECTSNKCAGNKCSSNKCTGNKCAGNECSRNECSRNKCSSNKCSSNNRYDSTDNADIDKFSRNVSTIDDGSAFDEPVSDHSAIHKSTSDLANYVYDPCNIDSNSIQFYGSCDDNPCRYSDSFGNHFRESCDNSSSGHNYTNKWKLSS